MFIFGGDIGFKQFKGVNLNHDIHFKFPNVIGLPSSLEIEQSTGSPDVMDDLSVGYEETMYYVGDKAIQQASNHRYTFLANKVEKIDERVKMVTALGILHEHGFKEIDLFVTGVPVEEYHQLKDTVNREFLADFEYTFRGRLRHSIVNEISVIPQGAGDYYDYILNEDGSINKDRIKPKTIIVNIGYRTTEIVTMNMAKFSSSESTTLYTATNSFHKELRKLLAKEYGIRKNLSQIDEIYRNGEVYVKGRAVDIRHLRSIAISSHLPNIIGEIPVWVNVDDAHEILLTGGGSAGLLRHFQAEFGDIVSEHNNPEYGNARGYAKYGRLITSG